MVILSAIVAALTAVMGYVYWAVPGPIAEGATTADPSIPLYVIIAGVVMSVVTYLSKNIYVFLRMFNAGYAIAFAVFAVLFLIFAYGGWPEWAPGWIQAMTPKALLAIAFTIYASIVLAISRLPIIHETIGLSETFFVSKQATDVRFFSWFRSREGFVGTSYHLIGILLSLGGVYISILFNQWGGSLFDSFEKKDAAAFWIAVYVFFVLASVWIFNQIADYLIGQYLLIRWRRFMSKEYITDWLRDDRHYKMQFSGEIADNPEQRIQEDVRSYVQSTTSISGSLFSTFLSLAAFVQLLWDLSTRFKFTGSEQWLVWVSSIPGYLVWICLIYAILTTFFGHIIGRPLVTKFYNKEKTEADFRYSMTRMREYSEQVSLLQGENVEKTEFNSRYDTQVSATLSLVRTTAAFRLYKFIVDQMSVIFPYLFIVPAYFLGAGSLGAINQTVGAFGQVQDGFSVFLSLYEQLANYKTAVNRITGFRRAMTEASAAQGLAMVEASGAKNIAMNSAEIKLPNGQVIAKVDELAFHPGQAALLTGPSGSGKSTLFRALAGIWPFGTGKVESPAGHTMMLLPQKPYLPLGTLRQSLSYPEPVSSHDESAIRDAMEKVGLAHLIPRLDESDLWARSLSGGEQQRVAIVRALLKKPDWLFLDEATAALDEPMEAKVYAVLRESLPGTTLVSIGHRATLLNFHDRRIDMKPVGDGSFTPVDTGARALPAE
jgi:vitamin B12/bleomycin/antimicrobial peptide transport system ATP-binding/permease protein